MTVCGVDLYVWIPQRAIPLLLLLLLLLLDWELMGNLKGETTADVVRFSFSLLLSL